MTEIRHLPDHLRIVPPAPLSPDDPEGEAKRAAFLEWRTEVYRFRVERQAIVHRHPELQEVERFKCADDIGYWLTVWGAIFEPRTRKTGSGIMPFIPFGKQLDMIAELLWTLEQDDENADAVVSKCRGVGASWIVCALALWGWLFKSPWSVLLISRKEEYVDSKKQASLFWKIDNLLTNLPDWMKPKITVGQERMKNILINPLNGNEITGESTTANSGRGGRVTWAAFDEAAFIPDFLSPWNGVAASTDHRWAISTENLDDGPDFYNLRTGNESEDGLTPHIINFDWWENPLNDVEWLERERKRMASNPGAFALEYLRDTHANSANMWVYPRAHDPLLEPDPSISVLPMAETFITCDPGKLDETALVVLQIDPATDRVNVLDAYQNKGFDAPFYASLLAGEPNEDAYPNAYGHREEEFMELIRQLPAPTYTGDTYGDTSNGATLETFYSVISKFENPQGERILFNRDRLGAKDKGMHAKSRTTYKGRRESLMEYVPRMAFADTSGARFALKCLRNHRYRPETTRGAMSEPNTPLHDWTSHVVQAFEFWGVFRKTRREILQKQWAKPQKATLYSKKSHHVARLNNSQARRYARTG